MVSMALLALLHISGSLGAMARIDRATEANPSNMGTGQNDAQMHALRQPRWLGDPTSDVMAIGRSARALLSFTGSSPCGEYGSEGTYVTVNMRWSCN